MEKQKLFTRNFTLLIVGQASSLVGNMTLKFALSMYVLELTGSASIFAGLLALALSPTILLSPFGGILADRVNRRTIMMGMDAASGVVVLAAALLLPQGHDIVVIGVLLVVLSVLAAFESPTVQACVPQMLSGDNVIKGNAAVSQVMALSSLLTPFLGSVFYTAVGLLPVMGVAVGCFFVTAILESFIRLPRVQPVKHQPLRRMVKEDFSTSMHFLRRKEPDILKLLLLAALVSFFVAGTAVVGFPYLVRTVLGLSATHYGAAESVLGVAAILGSVGVAVLAHRLQSQHLVGALLALGLCLLPSGAAFLLPMTALGRYGVLVLAFGVCQFACSFFSTYAISLVQSRTPEDLMGKVMAYVFTLSMCAQPIGQIVYGALFDRVAAQAYWVLLPSGVAVCVIAALSMGFFARLKTVGTRTEENTENAARSAENAV